MPATLDETYERMLQRIPANDQHYALIMLRWLAYAQRPLTLNRLAEAAIVFPGESDASDDLVDSDDRGGLEDALDLLAGLVVTVADPKNEDTVPADEDLHKQEISGKTIIRLAHFSVQEYLESPRISKSAAKDFQLHPGRDHRWITQSCLAYLAHYSASSKEGLWYENFEKFPLLEYAASMWYRHARLQHPPDDSRIVHFLESDSCREDWLSIHKPDFIVWQPSGSNFWNLYKVAPPLYCAITVGLRGVALLLIERGADINAPGGYYGNALQTALASDYADTDTAMHLIEHGADINAQGGYFRNALQAAIRNDHIDLAMLLIERGADIRAPGDYYDNALQAASAGNHVDVVLALLERGADVDAQGSHHGSALQCAARNGHMDVAKLLLERGADVNKQSGIYRNALPAAIQWGSAEVAMLLIESGADVNSQGGAYGNALQEALAHKHAEVAMLLIERGADVNWRGRYDTALYTAAANGFADVVRLLIDRGVDVAIRGGRWGNAFFAATAEGHHDIATLLLDAGFRYQDIQPDLLGRSRTLLAASYGFLTGLEQDLAGENSDVDAIDNHQWTALHWAAYFGRTEVVAYLLQRGVSSTKVDWQDWTAYDVAIFAGHEGVARQLEHVSKHNSSATPGLQSELGSYCDYCGHVSFPTATESRDRD